MKNTNYIESDNLNQEGRNKKKPRMNAVGITALILGSIVAAIVILLAGVTLYLTPDRLRQIVEKEGSRYLDADVKIAHIDYTFWSSFPNLHITVDSLVIDSRTLDSVTPEIRKSLPQGYRRLFFSDKISGAINLRKAISGDIALKDIEIMHPVANIVVVNDTLNNFNIFTNPMKAVNMPHLSFNSILIGGPVDVKWTGMPSKISGNVAIDKASMKFIDGKTDNYSFSMTGEVNLLSEIISTTQTIPFGAKGEITLGFSPLSMTFSKLQADAANIKTLSDGCIIAGNNNKAVIGKFISDFSCNDLFGITNYFSFPEEYRIKDMQGNVPVLAHLSLDAPFEFETKATSDIPMPAFSLQIVIPEGELNYHDGTKESVHLSDMALQADLNINPFNPESCALVVPLARAALWNTDIKASGKLDAIMSDDPLLTADISFDVDMSKATSHFFPNNHLKIDGIANGNASVTCRLSKIEELKMSDLNFKSDVNVPILKVTDMASKLTASLQHFSLGLKGFIPTVSTAGLGESKINIASKSVGGKLSVDGSETTFRNLLLAGSLGAKGNPSNPTLGGNINMKAASINSTSSATTLDVNGVEMALKAAMRHVPWTPDASFPTMPSSVDDSILLQRVSHTPLFLVADVPPAIQTALSLLNLEADLNINGGVLLSKGYPVRNEFSDVSITTDLDTLTINEMKVSTRGAEASVSGKISGIREFLMSSTPAPLKIDMDAHFNDVDINRLSGNYYAGQTLITGTPANYEVGRTDAYTAADSLCVIIPRNLYANLRLHSDKAEYMEWSFSPLSTHITLHDGTATIGDLTVGSRFATVNVDWTYSTEDLHNIFMRINADVDNFDIARFFKTFPMVTESAPELTNLSGIVNADAEGKLLMYPNMFLNAPSMAAEVNVTTKGVEFKREGKIKRISNLLFLKGDSPLKINNLSIHGTFHDNLLQLDPFMVDCGPYRLGLAGVNNLQGEIYYHLGVFASPLHLPFGVNIVGNWRHPSIRFGGSGIKDGRERSIAANLNDDVNVNIMRELKHGWLLFVENAAKYDAENNQEYVFNVK